MNVAVAAEGHANSREASRSFAPARERQTAGATRGSQHARHGSLALGHPGLAGRRPGRRRDRCPLPLRGGRRDLAPRPDRPTGSAPPRISLASAGRYLSRDVEGLALARGVLHASAQKVAAAATPGSADSPRRQATTWEASRLPREPPRMTATRLTASMPTPPTSTRHSPEACSSVRTGSARARAHPRRSISRTASPDAIVRTAPGAAPSKWGNSVPTDSQVLTRRPPGVMVT